MKYINYISFSNRSVIIIDEMKNNILIFVYYFTQTCMNEELLPKYTIHDG